MSDVVLMHANGKLAHRLRDVIDAAPELKVTGVANSLPGLREVFEQGLPDVLVVDLMLPPSRLKALLQSLRGPGHLSKPLILALAVSADDARLMDALRHGADGYYAHARPTTSLVAAIEQLIQGESTMSPQIAQQVKLHFSDTTWVDSDCVDESDGRPQLTEMDRLLLQWMAEGYLVNEVARGLRISSQAVGVRIRNIYRKLQFDLRPGTLSLAT